MLKFDKLLKSISKLAEKSLSIISEFIFGLVIYLNDGVIRIFEIFSVSIQNLLSYLIYCLKIPFLLINPKSDSNPSPTLIIFE